MAAASAAALTASPLPTAASFFTTAAIATIVSSTTFTAALTPAASFAGLPGAELALWAAPVDVGCVHGFTTQGHACCVVVCSLMFESLIFQQEVFLRTCSSFPWLVATAFLA